MITATTAPKNTYHRYVSIVIFVYIPHTLRNKVCQCLTPGGCFFTGLPVPSTNKTDRHYITKILLKVVLNTITLERMS
jgi:hypothetical protein